MTRAYLLAVFSVLALSACGGMKDSIKPEGGLFSTKGEGGLLNVQGRTPADAKVDPSSFRNETALDADVMGVKLKDKNFDIPVVYNEEVLSWLEYFTGPGRNYFGIYLERMARMEPVIVPKLKAAGLPGDLIYLAMIESGFSTSAKSHAGAVGPWQFIKSTGKLFGLKSDWWVEERRDPNKSTDAAIEYLSRLYAEFGDWHLACAAYNSGEVKIRNAISRLGTRDFWTIARDRKALRRETKDYVPKMIAAAIIGKNADIFGFKKYPEDNFHVDVEEIKIPKAENLRTVAKVARVDHQTLLELNPELSHCCTPPQKSDYVIKVPKGEGAKLLLSAIEAGEIGKYADFRRHVIRRGDSLSRIASMNGVPVEAILSMNEIRSVKGLKPGTELIIPDRVTKSSRSVASAPKANIVRVATSSAADGQKAVTYVVQKGDTLYTISRRYAVRIEQIRRWNAIHRSKNLRPGSRLTLYVNNDRSENI